MRWFEDVPRGMDAPMGTALQASPWKLASAIARQAPFSQYDVLDLAGPPGESLVTTLAWARPLAVAAVSRKKDPDVPPGWEENLARLREALVPPEGGKLVGWINDKFEASTQVTVEYILDLALSSFDPKVQEAEAKIRFLADPKATQPMKLAFAHILRAAGAERGESAGVDLMWALYKYASCYENLEQFEARVEGLKKTYGAK